MTYCKSVMAECYRAFRSDPLSPDYDREYDECGFCPNCSEDPCCCHKTPEPENNLVLDYSIQFIKPEF